MYNGAYINGKVKFDVQCAFLERPSTHRLLHTLTHMGLTCDPRAPITPPKEVLKALPPNPKIVELEQRREQLKAETYQIQGKKVAKKVRRLNTTINNAKTRCRNMISKQYRAHYFRHRPTEDIEKQSREIVEEEYSESVVQHQVQERAQLAELICTIAKDPTKQEILKRRISTIDLVVVLCHRRELQRQYQPCVTPLEELLIKEESPDPQPFPVVCRKTQCPFCIRDEAKTYKERTSSFCRPSAMMNHVERTHLRGVSPDQNISCRHPVCKSGGLVLKNLMHFKNHVQTVHGISLRA